MTAQAQKEKTTVAAFRDDADELHRIKRKLRLEGIPETLEKILENVDEDQLE